MWQEGWFRASRARRFFPVIYPTNKLVDMLELRHLLVTEHGYRLGELDDMALFDLEMTALIAVQTEKNKSNQR